jgi:hypothetical protein
MDWQMALEPDRTVTKLLLSSTSRFVGEYKSDNWMVTHAWPASNKQIYGNLGMFENPMSKNFYILAFKHPEFKHESIIIPDYTATGDNIIGLERIMRFCLLSFIHRYAFKPWLRLGTLRTDQQRGRIWATWDWSTIPWGNTGWP